MSAKSSKLLDTARRLDAAGKHEDALAAFRQFLEACPDSIDGWVDVGGLLLVLGRFQEAREACEAALRLDPHHYGAQVHFAAVLMHLGCLEAADACFREAIGREPGRLAGRLMHSDCLVRQGDLEQARAELEIVIEQEPCNNAALDRRNTLMVRQGDWPGLRQDMERQLAGYSGPEAEYVASHRDLLFGDMPGGWDRFESRLAIPDRMPSRNYPQPTWEGESFPGKTLLLTWEQGFGDSLMFLRFAPMVKALGGRVLLLVQPPLAHLAATCPGIDQVITDEALLPSFDRHVSLLSLPHLFRTRLDSIPAGIPYLRTPDLIPARQEIDGLLSTTSDRLRVALCWAGNSKHAKDAKRSLPPAALAPLSAVPGVAWYSFQFGAVEEPPLPGLVSLGPLLKGFSNTAHALCGMDLVITVDTVLAHLAGALGLPTFTLLSFIPDWRWLLGRDDSPWYPTMRLYRQPAPGDWRAVIQQVVSDLSSAE